MPSAAVLTRRLSAPALTGAPTLDTWSGYAAVGVDAAVNLREDRRYLGLSVAETLERAVEDQRTFLARLLDPDLGAVIDLRVMGEGNGAPLKTALVVRAQADDRTAAELRAQQLVGLILGSVPDSVVTRAITDEDELRRVLSPLGAAPPAAAVALARGELMTVPTREDVRQRFSYLYGISPLVPSAPDWSAIYQLLTDAPTPVCVSVALMPTRVSPRLTSLLEEYAGVYAQLAAGDRGAQGLYRGGGTLGPDTFAVGMAPVFSGLANRLRTRAYAVRALVASASQLPAGLAASVSSALAGGAADPGIAVRAITERRALSSELAGWDLAHVDVTMPDSAFVAWQHESPPPTELAAATVLVDPAEAANIFRFPIAATGDLPGIPVRRGRAAQSEATDGGRRPLLLGDLRDSNGQVRLDADALSKHALVAGSTGSGKTTFVLELLRQLWTPEDGGARRIPFLVIEPVNAEADDYRRLLGLDGFEAAELITIGDERHRPLRFNPFAVPRGVLVAEHMAALLDCFKAAFGLWDPLPAIYAEAVSETYLGSGVLPSETSGDRMVQWPTVIDFHQAMASATRDLGYSGEVKANLEAASVIRAQQLAFGPCATTFRTELPLDIEWLLERPVILELKSLGSTDEQALMIALLLSAITAHYKANRGAQSELRHVTVIEEAHRLLARARGGGERAQAKEQAAEAFANVLAENRKYGEGIVIAEQIPSKLVEDALKNTNLKVMCRLTSEEERTVLGQTMALNPEQSSVAARLQTGEAWVYADAFANAMEIRTPYSLGAVQSPAVERSATPPYAACTRCESRCHWRADGLTLSRRAAVANAAADVRSTYGQPFDGTDDALRQTRLRAPRTFARVVLGEVARYDHLSSGARSAVALCTVVHGLESLHESPAMERACRQLEATDGG